MKCGNSGTLGAQLLLLMALVSGSNGWSESYAAVTMTLGFIVSLVRNKQDNRNE